MRTFLLVLAFAFFGSFTTASAQNCGELEMSQLNFNAITYTAAFNALFEAYEAVTSPAAIYVDIQLDNHDPNVPPTMMPTFGWSLQTNNYLSQGRIRLRGLVLPGSTSVTSPVIEFDVLEGAGCALFKVDGAKFHRYRMNPCNVQVFGAYDEDCETREDVAVAENKAAESQENGKTATAQQSPLRQGLPESEVRLISANPFSSDLLFSVTASKPHTATLQLFSLTGQAVAERVVKLFEGENKVMLGDLSHLTPGVYGYRVINASGRAVAGKVVKR